jgi:hypothetical protein
MHSSFARLGASLVLGAGVLFAPLAQAAWQTVNGAQFDLSYDDSVMGLFGTPTLLGNDIVFTPVAFKAESLNGAGVVTGNSTINVRLLAHAGQTISGFSLLERGDYKLRGEYSEVSVGGQIRAFGLANPLSEVTDRLVSPVALNINDNATHNWTATASVALLSGATLINQSAGVNVTIENLLDAYTEASVLGPRLAFIEKKFADGGAVTLSVSTIPEPTGAALTLTALGMLGLGMRSQQRRA